MIGLQKKRNSQNMPFACARSFPWVTVLATSTSCMKRRRMSDKKRCAAASNTCTVSTRLNQKIAKLQYTARDCKDCNSPWMLGGHEINTQHIQNDICGGSWNTHKRQSKTWKLPSRTMAEYIWTNALLSPYQMRKSCAITAYTPDSNLIQLSGLAL